MLYKFKSKATGDLIMLEQHASQLLRIIGKEPAAKGILLCEHMPDALQAITEAIARHEAAPKEQLAQPGTQETDERVEGITLRQRAVPFMDMLRRCMAQSCDVVWGV